MCTKATMAQYTCLVTTLDEAVPSGLRYTVLIREDSLVLIHTHIILWEGGVEKIVTVYESQPTTCSVCLSAHDTLTPHLTSSQQNGNQSHQDLTAAIICERKKGVIRV